MDQGSLPIPGRRTGTSDVEATFSPSKSGEVENCIWYSAIGMLSFRRSPVSVGKSHSSCIYADDVALVDAFDFIGLILGAAG